jgi:hypothetical protein
MQMESIKGYLFDEDEVITILVTNAIHYKSSLQLLD